MEQEDLIRLVSRASSGDTWAFRQLIAALEPDLRRYLVRMVSPRPIVDDVLQETFIRLWKGLAWLQDPSLLKPWSFRIATREAHRMLGRELKREAQSADPTALDHLAVNFDDPSARLDIEAHLPSVSPGARMVVVAHYFEGLSLEEISSATHLPLGTIKSRLASGLVQLRKQLGNPR